MQTSLGPTIGWRGFSCQGTLPRAGPFGLFPWDGLRISQPKTDVNTFWVIFSRIFAVLRFAQKPGAKSVQYD